MLPDAIFIDTCIFEQERFNFESPVFQALFEALDKKSQVYLLLPQITEKEILVHIRDWCYGLADGVWLAVQKHPYLRGKFGMTTSKSAKDLGEELRTKYLKDWRAFLNRFKVQRLPYTDTATAAAMHSYFQGSPPFSGKKNKHEFPDALAFEALRSTLGQHRNIAVITKDKGFREACRINPGILHFMSLAQFTQLQLGEEEIVARLKDMVATELIPLLRDQVLSELDVFGYVTHAMDPLADVSEKVSFEELQMGAGTIIGLGGLTCTASCMLMVKVQAGVLMYDPVGEFDPFLNEVLRPVSHSGQVSEWVPVPIIVKMALTKDRGHIDHIIGFDLQDLTLTLSAEPQRTHK